MAKKASANVNAIQAVEALWKKLPAPLIKLLEKEGLEVGAEPPPRGGKASIERRLQKLGVLEQAKDWISSFASHVRLTLPSKSISISREIAWKYVEAKAGAERDRWLQDVYVKGHEDPNDGKLPIEINWVYRHPLIRSPIGEETPTLLKAGLQYETDHACPSNAARARLTSARQTSKSIESFMRHVDKLLTGTAASRKADEDAARKVGVVELAEEEAIADLEIQLLQEMEAKLVELGGDRDEVDASLN
jgi:hypothetical protein